jgi:polyisoprenoid-binding protein YceI
MGLPAGTYEFGPENGTLWVKTGRGGAAAAAGHDLLIQVTAWQATLEVSADPAETSVVLAADASSLRVHEGVGGMQPLGDLDKADIEQTIDNEVLKRTAIEFRSTSVQADDRALHVEGDLSLAGNVLPLGIDLSLGDDGKLNGTVVVTQSEWGIEPYSTLFGALKVNDEVEIVLNADWSGAGTGDWAPAWAEWRPVPIVDPGISSFVWTLVFFLYLWLGMAAIGVARGPALIYALLASCFIFLYVRTRGMGREDDQSA